MTKWDEMMLEKESKKTQGEIKDQKSVTFAPVLLKDISDDESHYEWLWENIIAKGHGTILTALFKSGKSTLIRALIKAMYEEQEFLGFPTRKCNILVISEESRSEWKNKAPDFGLDIDDLNLWISKPPFYGKSTKKSWESFILNDLFSFCIENKIDLVIIDTISRFWPVDKENDAGETGAALGILDKLKDNNIALLVVQQSNKQGGGSGKDVRGSTEIGGWPDEIIVFGKMDGDNQLSRRRQISLFGRLFELEDKLIVRLDHDNSYVAEGSKYQFSTGAKREVIIKVLTDAATPLSIKEIRDSWDEGLHGSKPSDDTVRRHLDAMIYMGAVRSVDTIIVVKRKVPRYGLYSRTYGEQQTADLTPYIHGGAVSSVKESDNLTHRSDKGIGNEDTVGKDDVVKKEVLPF